MSLSSLFFTTGIDGSGFKRGLMAMEAEAKKGGALVAKSINAKLNTLTAAGVTTQVTSALSAMVRSAKEFESAIGDAQDQFNLSASDIQRISMIASEAGTDLNAVAGAIDKISEARAKLGKGDAGIEKAFAAFGVSKSTATSGSISSLQILGMIGKSLGDTITEEQRRLFADLAGEKGKKIMAFVKEMNSAKPIALVSDGQLQALSKASDFMERIWNAFKAMNAAGFGQVAGSIQTGYAKGGFLGAALAIMNAPMNFAVGAGTALGNARNAKEPIGANAKASPLPTPEATRRKVFGGMETRGGVDSLASVGLFVRGGAGSLVDVQRRQLDVLTRMEAMQRDLLRVTREVL